MEKQKPEVNLIGENGNAFYILGRVEFALRSAGYTREEIDEYRKQATSSDYSHLLAVTSEWVDII